MKHAQRYITRFAKWGLRTRFSLAARQGIVQIAEAAGLPFPLRVDVAGRFAGATMAPAGAFRFLAGNNASQAPCAPTLLIVDGSFITIDGEPAPFPPAEERIMSQTLALQAPRPTLVQGATP